MSHIRRPGRPKILTDWTYWRLFTQCTVYILQHCPYRRAKTPRNVYDNLYLPKIHTRKQTNRRI